MSRLPIALHDLNDIYLTCERLRRNMLQVAYVLSLRRTSTSSTGDGLPITAPQYFKS
jgi:hypothetical protein